MKAVDLQAKFEQPGFLDQILPLWQEVTNSGRVPHLMGFDCHPDVLELRYSSKRRIPRSAWHKLLCKVIFHADLSAQFATFEAASGDHTSMKKQEIQSLSRQQWALAGRPLAVPVSEDNVATASSLRHVRALASSDQVFSFPVPAGALQTLPEALRLQGVGGESMLAGDIEDDSGMTKVSQALEPQQHHGDAGIIFVCIVDERVSAGTYCKTMPGAGTSSLRAGDMAIAVYPQMPGSMAERPTIASQPLYDGAMPIQILKPTDVSPGVLEQMAVWRRGTVVYFFESGGTSELARTLLTSMVSTEAFPDREACAFEPKSESEKELLQSWMIVGLVARAPDSHVGWLLTEAGMEALDSCIPCVGSRCLSKPRAVLVQEKTEYELLKLLQAQGWWWAKFIKQRPTPPYRIGGPLVWSTSG